MNDSKKNVNQDSQQQLQHHGDHDDDEAIKSTLQFLESLGISSNLPQNTTSHDFFSKFLGSLLMVDAISKGCITCSFTVQPPLANAYKGFHGGAVASIAERLAIACARTIVSEDKPLFLGELRASYLSATPINTKLIADGSVLRSGRNSTVVSIEFRLKESKKLVYTAQATFLHLPTSKL